MNLRLWPSQDTRRRWKIRTILRLAERSEFHGITLGLTLDTEGSLQVQAERLRTALELIRTHDAPRFARLRRDLAVILVAGDATIRGRYHRDLKLCELYHGWLGRPGTTPLEVAMVLAHEAAHGHLSRVGVRTTPERRFRIERVCCQAEIALAKKLPGSGRLLIATRRMQAAAPWVWGDAALRLRRTYQAIRLSGNAMHDAGCPRWLVGLLQSRDRRRLYAAIRARRTIRST